MPLYEYECAACGHRFEVIQKFSDPPVEKCPACGGPVHKLMSSPAFQFKGTGWYATDYAKKSGAPPGKDAKDAAPTENKTEAKDTKPAAADPAAPTSSTTKAS
jgi:putative FmdB family regulatory protein